MNKNKNKLITDKKVADYTFDYFSVLICICAIRSSLYVSLK